MSVVKKRAAPKPPAQNPTAGLDKEDKIISEKENGKEPVKEKPRNETVPLKVVFPNQSVIEIQIAPSTPLIDVRTQICTKYKYSAGSHKLEPVDDKGRAISFTSSSTVASTAASAVHLKPKAKEPVKAVPTKVVEQTVRLTIKMSRSNVQILRVRPNVPLTQLLPQIREKTGVKQEDYKHLELRHPDQIRMSLDTSRNLDDYSIREIFVADKRVHTQSTEPEMTSLNSSEKTPKSSRGGSEKRSKKFKRFFGLSKKHKSSSASDDTVSPTASSPPFQEATVDQSANTNGNNSAERETVTKKKRHAPVKQTNRAVTSEPLHGQVPEKINDMAAEATEQEEPAKAKVVEKEEDHSKKKAPQPPTANASSSQSSPVEPSSPPPVQKPSRPEKPPRRQSVEKQKEPTENITEEDGAEETHETASNDTQSSSLEKPDKAEISIADASEDPSLMTKEEIVTDEDSDIETEVKFVSEDVMLSPEDNEKFSDSDIEKPDQKEEEEPLKAIEDAPEPFVTPEPIKVEQEPQDEWVILTEQEIVDSKASETERNEEVPDVPVVSEDVSEQEELSVSEDAPQDSSEIKERLEKVAQNAVEVTVLMAEKVEEPEPVAAEETPEMASVPAPVESDIHHDVLHNGEDVITEQDLREVVEDLNSEEDLPPPPLVDADEPGLRYSDSHGSEGDDSVAVKEKTFDVTEEFVLAEKESLDTSKEDVEEDSYPLPPPPDALESEAFPPAEKTEDIPETLNQNTDDETVQEIERVKEQINLMKQKKEEMEIEEKKPYTIIPETKPSGEPGLGQSSGVKTYTFVPNQRQKKVYEDYEAAPEVGINLSQSGELNGVGVALVTAAENPPAETGPLIEQPAPLSLDTEISSPKTVLETAPVMEAEKPPTPVSQSKPSDMQPKPLKPTEMQSKPIPKAPGGYVSSAMMKQPVTTTSVPPPKYLSTSHDAHGKKSALPNYYWRFLGIGATAGTAEKTKAKRSPEKPAPIATVTTPAKTSPSKPLIPEKPKSPPAVAKVSSSAPSVQAVSHISAPAQTLPAPPEETYSAKSFDTGLEDVPLPPPPEEFLTVDKEKGVSKLLPLDLPSPTEQPTQSQEPASSSNRVASPGFSPMSSNLVGISSAKPFGAKASASGPRFRPMSAAFKGGKTGKPNSP